MIRVLDGGYYSLLETKRQTKILTLGNKTFAWISAAGIGEILITSYKKHETGSLLATGKYRLYEVKDEPEFTDLAHLELLVGDGMWQGYLLPTGLPDNKDRRNRIIPTEEIITRSVH